jgi:hypothetical protein
MGKFLFVPVLQSVSDMYVCTYMCTYFISILCSVHAFCTTAACNNTPTAVCLSHSSNTLVTMSPAQRPAPAHTRHLAAHSRSLSIFHNTQPSRYLPHYCPFPLHLESYFPGSILSLSSNHIKIVSNCLSFPLYPLPQPRHYPNDSCKPRSTTSVITTMVI